MIIKVFDEKVSLGQAGAQQAADAIRRAIRQKDQARIIAATGASQFELLETLTGMPGIAWERSRCSISTNTLGCRRTTLPASENICGRG
jgi:6-phosphogluconolactonase/glucosamine-6-phosphate isomerase/deaminase